MKNRSQGIFLGFLIAIALFSSYCTKSKTPAPELTVSVSTITFASDGGSQDITVNSNADWSVSNPAFSWLQLSATSGNGGSTVIHVTASSPNGTGASRSAILNLTSSNGQARRVTVTQGPTIFPTYNTSPIAPDMTGMMSTAVEQAANMKLGINIGNTFEAEGSETAWGSPVITVSFIQYLKQKGFNSIRLPCAWDWHHIIDRSTERIDPSWLARVKEVVGYCTKNNMYVLLNIHWDGGWLESNSTLAKRDSVNAKQKALWEQIATTMRDFDGHLMFASANEPSVNDAVQMEVLNSYHQTFIDAVRSTGGKNSYRVLVIQGPSTDLVKTIALMNTLPVDKIKDRIMVEIHDYTPFQFTLLSPDATWGKMFYYWGTGHLSTIEPSRNATNGGETELNGYFQGIKQKFVDKGIPVIMGEYAAMRRTTPLDMAAHQASVDYWITFNTKQAIANGLIPFYWDVPGSSSIFNRQNNTVTDQRTLDAIIAGTH